LPALAVPAELIVRLLNARDAAGDSKRLTGSNVDFHASSNFCRVFSGAALWNVGDIEIGMNPRTRLFFFILDLFLRYFDGARALTRTSVISVASARVDLRDCYVSPECSTPEELCVAKPSAVIESSNDPGATLAKEYSPIITRLGLLACQRDPAG